MNTVYTVEQIKNKLTPIFENEPVYKAVLFGSYATGEATEKSDIDIMIDSRGALANWNLYGVLHDITQTMKKDVDLFEIVEIQPESSLLKKIQDYGITIYEKLI